MKERCRMRVFNNRVLIKIFGPKRKEVTWDGRKLQNEELHDLYCAPNIVQAIKSRSMRRAGHVAHTGEKRKKFGIWWGKLKERDHLEDLDVDVPIILKWSLKKSVGRMWTGLLWLALHRHMRQALVNVVMNLRLPQNSQLAEKLSFTKRNLD
jgi:hypothetical protein